MERSTRHAGQHAKVTSYTFYPSHLRQPSLLLLDLPLLRRLHPLSGNQLRVPDLLKVLLVSAHGRQLLLLEDLHEALLKHLPDENLEDGLHLKVEIKEIAWREI